MRILILAATAATLMAAPALAAKTAAAAAPATTNTVATAKPATPSAKPKGESKMAKCAAEWKALGDKGHVAYNDKAKTMKSKKGNKLSGYNAFTGECMKR